MGARAFTSKEDEVIELLKQGKPGIAIRKCVELGITPERWGKILRAGVRTEIWGYEQVTLCYGIVWCKKTIPRG